MHSPEWGKRTAVQIVFGTLSTCYFISQMENNNTDSGVGTAERQRFASASALRVCPLFLNMQSDFGKRFWRGDWRIQMMINDKVCVWQSTGYWGKSYRISTLMQKNWSKKGWTLDKQGGDFSLIAPVLQHPPLKLNECVRSWMIYTFGLI